MEVIGNVVSLRNRFDNRVNSVFFVFNMSKKTTIALIIIFLFAILPFPVNSSVFAGSVAAEYLCDFAMQFYRSGRYEEALSEFKKALLIDPENKTALEYINNIFQKESQGPIVAANASRQHETFRPTQKPAVREEAMKQAFKNLSKSQFDQQVERDSEKERYNIAGIKITGETQASFGATPDDVIWKRANFDLNEENYRILSNAAYDRRSNTFDPRIFDRLRVNLDTDNEEGLNFHSNITVDPWSFTGKSNNITVFSDFGDSANVQLKYWSNTGYTVNETVRTQTLGNSFSLPELKVYNEKTKAFNTQGVFSPPDTFHIPEIKINREFQPMRELWFDYNKDGLKLRVFPIAYENQALASDDPLRLSNNHIYWENSPWINRWLPGHVNSGAVPQDFSPGELDNSLSYFTRDSDGTRLTALRGFSFGFEPQEEWSFLNTLASPRHLWQNYEEFDNVINSMRIKYRPSDILSIGTLYNYRVGFNVDDKHRKDMYNHVWGLDIGYEPILGLKLSAQTASSRVKEDLTSPGYETKARGNAYYFSLIGTAPGKSLSELKYGYDEIKPEKFDEFFSKFRFFVSRMDAGFQDDLSNYTETRDDQFWSRHLHFREPFKYYFSGLYAPSLTWDDVSTYRIGNGIDTGRDVFAFRLENSLWNKTVENLFDVRNVHKTEGKFAENVARDELTYQVNDNLTTKTLLIYHRLPKTTTGFDPFIIDADTGEFMKNALMPGDKNATLKTGSLGLKYAFTDWLDFTGIWERTNDYSLAYDNFPRGNLNSSSFATTSIYDQVYRNPDPFLYSQTLFPLPPYSFYNIWKTGLRIEPVEKLNIYLDYTRNEFKSAGQVDDNINHVGLEVSYLPTKKFGLFFKYTYSRWNDVNRMLSGQNKIYLGHHNFFSEFRWFPGTDDQFVLQYGESGLTPISTVSYDPFGGSLAALDTRHIVRLFYRRSF